MQSTKPKVLVVVVKAGPKKYCENFFPRFANILQYENKEILLVTEKNCPALRGDNCGDTIAANGRQFGIEYAIEHEFDFIYFQDLDFEPTPDMLDALVALDKPLAASLVAGRGDPFHIIGHNYKDMESLERVPLYFPDLKTGDLVAGMAAASLLVNKIIFEQVDYSGYTGINIIPGRTTCDDEYYLLKVLRKTGFKTAIIKEPRGWHYHSDGYKYRLLGEKIKY